MKKVLLITSIIIFGNLFAGIAHAVTPLPTAAKTVSPTVSETLNEKLNTQINQLKDKIASRVTELNLVEKRGITGVVSEATTNKLTLTDIAGNTKLIDIDEITKFSSSATKGTFGLSDLTKGTKVNVLGLYNKQSKRILARFITTAVNPLFISGTISGIDGKNFTIDIVTSDKKTSKIDIGATTKLSSYSKNGETVKILFSKLNSGDRVSIVGFPDKTDPTLSVASRVVVLSDLPKDPSVSIAPPSPTASPTDTLRKTIQVPDVTSNVKKPSPIISR